MLGYTFIRIYFHAYVYLFEYFNSCNINIPLVPVAQRPRHAPTTTTPLYTIYMCGYSCGTI